MFSIWAEVQLEKCMMGVFPNCVCITSEWPLVWKTYFSGSVVQTKAISLFSQNFSEVW
jgi:hypothetical protein